MGQMIFIGNSINVMRSVKTESVDLIVTSPPYDKMRDYNGHSFTWQDFELLAPELYRVLKKRGVMVWVVGDQTVDGSETLTSFRQALHFKSIGLKMWDTMIYHTSKPPLTHPRYEQAFEYMFVMTKGGSPKTFNGIRVPKTWKPDGRTTKGFVREKNGARDMGIARPDLKTKLKGNIWFYPPGSYTDEEKWVHEHPAIYPYALARDHVQSWSKKGDLVLDPFAGCGTTGKAAKALGRNFIGIEISAKYAKLACRRIGTNRAYVIENQHA